MGNKITRRRPAIDERYTRPQGLYPCRDVDHRKLRRLILDSKLAPCYPGAEEADKDLEECPICYLQYPSLNRSKCCAKGVCTECFLQMKSPHATRPTQCPFCKTPCYAVEYRGAKTLEEKGMEQAEEQKVIEAKIRMRQQELQDDEEREKRRIEGRLPTPRAPPSAVAPIDDDWGTANRHRQLRETSALDERNTSGMDPYALWVDGDYQRAGGFDITAPAQQQSTVSVSANVMSQQQTQTHLSTPDRRRENLDLDLEDLMIMEAIWLSIQDEQGTQHRSSSGHPSQRTTNRRRSESLAEISLDSESDDEAGSRLLPPPLHSVPESEPLWNPQAAIRVGELSNEATVESAGSVASDATSGESSEGGVKLSFEEQMVMAMALSITDAPTTRVRSGPLMGH